MLVRCLGGCVLAFLIAVSRAPAQSFLLPTAAPTVSAVGHDWYDQRLPIFYAGDRYYPAGPRYHFDPDIMVPAGSFDGVPLFVDTSVEPYSQVLIPIGGGLVQPYERRRVGALAGTTGSFAPDFPVDVVPWEGESIAPGYRAQAHGAPQDTWPREPRPRESRWPAADEEARQQLLQPPGHIETIRVPDDNRGIWITYEGQRWNVSGKAVPFDAARFAQMGRYFGFPVFAARGTDEIFLPAWPGMLAVYKKDAKEN